METYWSPPTWKPPYVRASYARKLLGSGENGLRGKHRPEYSAVGMS
jgi:hypothetical protein